MNKSLFKYCPINDYTLQNLNNNQLYFNKPKLFNDPYEGIFKFDVKDMSLKHDLIKFLYPSRFQEVIGSGHTIDDIINYTTNEYINQFLNDMRVCCMSYINNSMLMWSHYTEQHTGICIEFDSDNTLFKAGAEVKYSDEIPCLTIESKDDISEEKLIQVYNKVVTNKYKDWNYEKEYRLFRYRGKMLTNYDPVIIRAIYFGLRCAREHIDKIKAILSGNKNIKYYKADLESGFYKFRFSDITN